MKSFNSKINEIRDEIHNLKIEKIKVASTLKTAKKSASLSYHIKADYFTMIMYPEYVIKLVCTPSHEKNMVGMMTISTHDGRSWEFLPIDDGNNLSYYVFPSVFTTNDGDHFDWETGEFHEFDISGTFTVTATDDFTITTSSIPYPYLQEMTINEYGDNADE